MSLKKSLFMIPLVVGLIACGDDSSDSPTAVTPTPTPENPGTPSTPTTPGTPAASAVALPAGASLAVASNFYNVWKNRWVISIDEEVAGGSTLDYAEFNDANAQAVITQKMGSAVKPARVIWDGGSKKECPLTGMTSWKGESFTAALSSRLGCTVSEGIGYGMLLASIHEDWPTFNALWAYNLIARNLANSGLMPWKLQGFVDKLDNSAALDADLDVATSLILAWKKTKQDMYLNDALALLAQIYQFGINPSNLLIYPGETWRTRDVYNLSYFSPVAFRQFAEVDPSHDWNAVIAANYAYMTQVQAAGAVPLFPDWSNAAGEPVDPKNNSAATSYMLFDKESVRIPWRIAWDYYWYQSPEAAGILTKMSTFISTYTSNNPAALPVTSFNYLTGELSTSGTPGHHYTGMYCLMGMGVNQPWFDACYAYFNANMASYAAQGYSGTYFMEILMNMFGSLMNGAFVKI